MSAAVLFFFERQKKEESNHSILKLKEITKEFVDEWRISTNKKKRGIKVNNKEKKKRVFTLLAYKRKY